MTDEQKYPPCSKHNDMQVAVDEAKERWEWGVDERLKQVIDRLNERAGDLEAVERGLKRIEKRRIDDNNISTQRLAALETTATPATTSAHGEQIDRLTTAVATMRRRVESSSQWSMKRSDHARMTTDKVFAEFGDEISALTQRIKQNERDICAAGDRFYPQFASHEDGIGSLGKRLAKIESYMQGARTSNEQRLDELGARVDELEQEDTPQDIVLQSKRDIVRHGARLMAIGVDVKDLKWRVDSAVAGGVAEMKMVQDRLAALESLDTNNELVARVDALEAIKAELDGAGRWDWYMWRKAINTQSNRLSHDLNQHTEALQNHDDRVTEIEARWEADLTGFEYDPDAGEELAVSEGEPPDWVKSGHYVTVCHMISCCGQVNRKGVRLCDECFEKELVTRGNVLLVTRDELSDNPGQVE